MEQIKIRRVDFYPDDWIAGTVGLSHEERSIYISVCVAIWSRGECPVDEKFVRKICPGEHFKRGLDKLIAKGKVTRIATENGPKLAQKRAENELKTALKRTESSLANGAKGGRPNGLEKPGGFGPTRTRATPPSFKKERELTSSVGEVSARARAPNGGATHAHDDDTVAWRPLGNAMPLANTTPPPLFSNKAERAAQHWNFLNDHGASGEAERYYAAMMESGSEWPPDEIFNAVEARMTA